MEKYSGHIIDPVNRRIFDGTISVSDGVIVSVYSSDVPAESPYYLPGFIDSHVHVESSMMMPSEFARLSSSHGSVGAVCDPHEIANVLGIKGIELMIDNASEAGGFHFLFGAPSCVPAVGGNVETSGAVITSEDIKALMQHPQIGFLGEMMNFPAVVAGDPEVMAKIRYALEAGKPVDGHAPGLSGDQCRAYAAAGISTDHECTTLDEARFKVGLGMYILIRQGSAAKDYKALAPLIGESSGKVMFCTDDSHPETLMEGHIDRIVRMAISDGYDIMDILNAACVVPVRHYGLPVGLLQKGDGADFICIDSLEADFRVLTTYINGKKYFDAASATQLHAAETPAASAMQLHAFETPGASAVQYGAGRGDTSVMRAKPLNVSDIATDGTVDDNRIIVAYDRSLYTKGEIASAAGTDVNKLVVYNRFTPGAKPAVAHIRGFGLKGCAIAQTIAHDCHNIIAIGSDDSLIVEAVNRVIALGGGIVVTDGQKTGELALEVGGIISTLPAEQLAAKAKQLDGILAGNGCNFSSPFITLAFMALPVIPELKLTDRGLFDSLNFRFV